MSFACEESCTVNYLAAEFMINGDIRCDEWSIQLISSGPEDISWMDH